MISRHTFGSAAMIALVASACSATFAIDQSGTDGLSACATEVIVLGAGQDAGAPQIGNPDDPAWQDPSLRLTASSIALVNHVAGERYLFDATPHITDQLNLLDALAPVDAPSLGLSGVFLTHAHIGHYAGLMFIGHEAAGASDVPVHVMPRMHAYLGENGPWSQLVSMENIQRFALRDRAPVSLPGDITVTPYRVPHRDEYSETVGFVIETIGQSVLYLPDIDSWEEWETRFDVRLDDIIGEVDHAFIDATFFDDHELPGRDMSQIPHPRVTATMTRLSGLADEQKAGIHFIHYNHTNPIRFPDSAETADVRARGFDIARAGDRHCLVPE